MTVMGKKIPTHISCPQISIRKETLLCLALDGRVLDFSVNCEWARAGNPRSWLGKPGSFLFLLPFLLFLLFSGCLSSPLILLFRTPHGSLLGVLPPPGCPQAPEPSQWCGARPSPVPITKAGTGTILPTLEGVFISRKAKPWHPTATHLMHGLLVGHLWLLWLLWQPYFNAFVLNKTHFPWRKVGISVSGNLASLNAEQPFPQSCSIQPSNQPY